MKYITIQYRKLLAFIEIKKAERSIKKKVRQAFCKN